ncbi:MAG: hypothetical protein BWK76_13650 [Desulfobulbaceae bacterium A2]|nr:MAG: hypothetical protein BWK76_13650 [Desulfobulbaceae bacterium A2]
MDISRVWRPIGLSQFFQLTYNVNLVRSGKVGVLRMYMYLIGFLYFVWKKQERERIRIGLHHVFHETSSFARIIFLNIAVLRGIFEHYLEKMLAAHKPLDCMFNYLGRRLVVQNKKLLDDLASSGQGGILVTGHFGAVEYLPMALFLQGYKIAFICRFKTLRLKQEVEKRAVLHDVLVIDANEPKVTFKALDAIKSGRILLTECDEFSEWRMDDKEHVRVFGHAVPLDRTLDFFYRRTRVPVVMGLMRRDAGGFTLCLEPLADGAEKVCVARAAWTTLESYIMRYPQQWYQWKDVVRDLAPFIDWRGMHADRQSAPVPAGHSVPSPGLS